jgi:manganese/zinc/iron transport system ATP- binding protein
MSDSLFSITNLTVAYDLKPVLYEVTLEVPRGRLMAIVGPNGAGKSTLIKAALGLIPMLTGRIEAFGKPFEGHDSRIGYVPQRESVDWDFPVTVFDVAMMGTYSRVGWLRRPSTKEVDIARSSLEKVGMLDFKDRQISQLSGGQQQRVFLARALAQQADLYFMDEPFAGVDASTEQAIIQLLRTLREQGKTVVAVHHDLQTVADYFDDVALINLRLMAAGPVETTMTPENLRKTYGGRLGALEAVAKASTEAR